MAFDKHTFPQNGDNDFAENFGAWIGRSNITDYVEEGLTFQNYDSSVPEIDVTKGKLFISQPSKTISSNNEDRLTLDYAFHIPGATLSLSDGAVNYVYVQPNFSTNDSPAFNVETNQSNAGPNDLLIGTVDTSADTFDDDINRRPDATFDRFRSFVDLGIPVYDNISDAETGQGNIIFITGNGSDPKGLHLDDGSGFKLAGVKDIDDLDDVLGGITELREDLIGNRPTAGTAGRYFFATDEDSIYRDNGSSWDKIATGEHDTLDGINTDDHHTYPVPNSGLVNDDVTVTAGDGLKGGGQISLGGSTTLDIEPVDFAGTFLSDDGADNLQVNLGAGLEGDGSGNVRVDEDYDFTFTSAIDFSAGLDVQGDITDGTQVIWDVSAQEIPDSAMGAISNSTLANSSITVTAGDGLKNGGTVSLGGSTTVDIEPADFAGSFLSDDGSDNLQVDIGTGLVNNGQGSIRVDENYSFSFTGDVTFTGFTSTNTITLDGNSANVSDGTAVDAPTFEQTGYYDSDSTTSVNPASQRFIIDHQVSYNGSSGASTVEFRAGGTDLLRLNEPSSLVEIPNGDLQLSNGQNIQDNNGVDRINISGVQTMIYDDAGDEVIGGVDGFYNAFWASQGQPLQLRDREAGGVIAEYVTVSSGLNEFIFNSNVQLNSALVDGSKNKIAQSVAATGQVQLSSGTAVVDTGISATDATFNLALGVDDPGADTKIGGRLFWDDSTGTYKIEFVENGTSVGNPTVNYDVIRVR